MSYQIRAEKEQSSKSPTLITSLPDDITVNIIARVPICNYPTISLVSKHFHSLVTSPELYARRSLLGCTEQCLYAVLYNVDTDDYRLYILRRKDNISSFVLIQSLPPMSYFNGSFIAVGSKIYMLGGGYHGYVKSSSVIRCGSHTVQPLQDLPKFMACRDACIIDGKIYVTVRKGIRVFDTETGMWEPGKRKPDIGVGLGDVLESVVMGDKIYMKDSWNSYVYEPKESKWEKEEMLNSKWWTNACVVEDVLYYFSCGRNKLRAYDPNERRWRLVRGVKDFLPKNLSWCWPYTVSYGGNLVLFLPLIHDGSSTESGIWCAEIALERCITGEIRGKVEWCDVVLSEDFRVVDCVAVMV